jgi:hypothetical protein
MKKREVFVLCLFLISILTINLILADTNGTIEERAYSCLKDEVSGKVSSLSLEEQSFALLALAHDSSLHSDLIIEINKEKDDDNCFPDSSSCKVKETALATLALNYAKQSTLPLEDWLLEQKIRPENLNIYLVIDSEEKTECTIDWDGDDTDIDISEDKKISGASGCFQSANNGYWLKIKESCLDENFTISCEDSFISTLLYQKSSGDNNVWYVSDEVESASANGETQHTADYFCFSDDGDECDYESSLWATLALQKSGHNIKNFIPYLVVFADENSKLFSDSFLYYFTSSDDYLENILDLQKDSGYWDLASAGERFYDTALALLFIQSSSSDALDLAIDWLEDVQDSEGCWNNKNIRDTAFLLWAGWPRASVGGEIQLESCTEAGYYCLPTIDCEDAEGSILSSYYCSGVNSCCSKNIVLKNCNQISKFSGYSGYGEECTGGKVCSVSTTVAADTQSCCLGGCIEADTETDCEEYGNTCRSSCNSNEEITEYYDCDGSDVCCREKESGGIPGIIWFLIILIIIVIILIIFRNRIKILIFKKKSGFKEKGAGRTTRPGFFPPSSGSIPRQQYPQRQPMPALRTIPRSNQLAIRQPAKRDKELEETMKKLREMSK